MTVAKVVRALKTPVTLLLLVAFVALVGRWALKAATEPVPPPPPDPCVMTDVGDTLTPERLTIRVLNGTTTDGLAKRYAAILRAEGFIRVEKTANADSNEIKTSHLVGHKVDNPEVQLLARAFKDIEIRADGRPDHTVDFVIGEEFAGWAENPEFAIPVDGEVCLPQIRTATTSE